MVKILTEIKSLTRDMIQSKNSATLYYNISFETLENIFKIILSYIVNVL